MRLRRSLLMTPGDNEELLGKATHATADVVWMDLEDGIHPNRVSAAHAIIRRALGWSGWQCRERLVRINQVSTGAGLRDIAALRGTPVDGLVLPKVESAAEVTEAARAVSAAWDGPARPSLWPMIESPRGLYEMRAIGEATGADGALIFGAGEYRSELRSRQLPEERGGGPFGFDDLLYPRSALVNVARALGLSSLDGSSPADDPAAATLAAEYTFSLGFDGKLLNTPRGIAFVHAAYGPTETDVAWALGTLRQLRDLEAKGLSVARIDGTGIVAGPLRKRVEEITSRAVAVGMLRPEEIPLARPGS